jgi:alpha-tubulin suppressor-like RCC1 family protein
VLGLFDKRLLPTPVVGGISFVQLTASTYNTCGISSAGAAFCWGDNLRGQLGEGRTMPRSLVPTQVAGGLSFVALTAGGLGTCGLTSDAFDLLPFEGGVAYCWGYNLVGQLGDGTTQDRSVPTPVSCALNFGQLSKGSPDSVGHTCGRTAAGTVYCWGYNGAGQLGDGTQQSRLVPTPVKSP